MINIIQVRNKKTYDFSYFKLLIDLVALSIISNSFSFFNRSPFYLICYKSIVEIPGPKISEF